MASGLNMATLPNMAGRAELYKKDKALGKLSNEELMKMKEELQRFVKKGDPVLVLGATPGLRNIALDIGCKVLAIDFNLDMITKQEGRISQRTDDDVVVRGNWLFPWYLKNNFFKAILADASFNNVPSDKILQLLDISRRLLAHDGCLLFRHCHFYKEKPIEELVQLYKKRKLSDRDIFLLLYFHKDLPRSYSKGMVYVPENFDAIIAVLQKHKIRGEIISIMKMYRWDGNYSILEEKDFKALLKKHFHFKTLKSKKLPYSSHMPLYVAVPIGH
ncbi:class I SAM-dependent methyltransferase [Candidatus Woesearchaeota archaeon]|nr:class I SAM-dependent methyltransferase [Candidatus Woesearchaeota archaeon]